MSIEIKTTVFTLRAVTFTATPEQSPAILDVLKAHEVYMYNQRYETRPNGVGDHVVCYFQAEADAAAFRVAIRKAVENPPTTK